MDELDVLARNYGFKPQGKSAPMRSDAADRRSSSVRSSTPYSESGFLYDDVFGGSPNSNHKSSSMGDYDYDSIFKPGSDPKAGNNSTTTSSKASSFPVYDKPVYDDEVVDDFPGVKSKAFSSSSRFEDDVFASVASSPPKKKGNSDQFDDLFGNLGKSGKVEEPRSGKGESSRGGFDDLLVGFGSGSPASNSRPIPESKQPSKSAVDSSQASNMLDDPFVVLESTSTHGSSSQGMFIDPLEEFSKLDKSGSKADVSASSGGVFNDLDPLNGFGKSVPSFSSGRDNGGNDRSPSSSAPSVQSTAASEHTGKFQFGYPESQSQKAPVDSFDESPLFDMPKSYGQAAAFPPNDSANYNETNSQSDVSPRSEEQVQTSEDIWLTVSEIPLFTQPTSAPPPSRPPPPIPRRFSKSEAGSFSSNARKRLDESSPPSYSSQYSQSPRFVRPEAKSTPVSQLDELENFAMGGNWNSVSGEEMNANSAADAMKEAMDRAEAKFRHAKELRERENAKAGRNRDTAQFEKDENFVDDAQEREFIENQERLEQERRLREKEEEEREQRRVEKERERARELERGRARQAVERATREARERAAAEARKKAAAEAQLKADRLAVQRAQAEARERAAIEARERQQRAVAEAKEREIAEAREKEAKERAAAAAKVDAEARRRAERAAVERVAKEARERAAAEARERAAAAARMNQQRNDNDLESFFSMGSRAQSAPRPRANISDPVPDPLFQSMGGSERAKTSYSSGGASSNMRKASSTTNIVDDLSSIFGATPSSGEFPDVEGESEERRRARLERHQRTQERAAKALAEKNQRDLQVLREQEERHRIAETLDFEIKRWSAGKEGNLRALLSTLQYVLWPECGWQPVSLTDLITGASVKKVYRKATLCIHPDKVQQKGATLQQKYIAEKVFDLLKEAWNKFNSEELF